MSPRQQNQFTGDEATPAPKRILVVDGDRQTRLGVSTQLMAMGFDVVVEEDVTAWVLRIEPKLDRGGISGVLLELPSTALNSVTGLLERIRERYADIPVIVMSGMADIAGLRKAVELGAREYLVKPFDAELLKTKCLRVFRNAEQRS